MNGWEYELSKKDKLSVFISLVLRHKPDAAGIQLDEHGWANADEMINGINSTGRKIDMNTLEEIVATDEKGRYSFNENKTLIRANQGHSIPVDVELKEQEPPEFLYHGTAGRFMENILVEGLKPMGRLYVQCIVVVLFRGGNKFYLSENGVCLIKSVPVKYFNIMG